MPMRRGEVCRTGELIENYEKLRTWRRLGGLGEAVFRLSNSLISPKRRGCKPRMKGPQNVGFEAVTMDGPFVQAGVDEVGDLLVLGARATPVKSRFFVMNRVKSVVEDEPVQCG